jgi:hypothetical protein
MKKLLYKLFSGLITAFMKKFNRKKVDRNVKTTTDFSSLKPPMDYSKYI